MRTALRIALLLALAALAWLHWLYPTWVEPLTIIDRM